MISKAARVVSWQEASCAMGVLALGFLWVGPLVPLSRTSFSAHMLLHLGLVVGAAPLIAVRVAGHFRTPAAFSTALGWYGLAAAVEMLAVWTWHLPALHDLAGRNALYFGGEQLSFLLGGVALWAAIFTARNVPAALAAVLFAAWTFTHMTMFGLLLAIVPSLIYDPDLCLGGFGLGPLDDQHLGGAFMAAGGLIYLTAAAGLVARIGSVGKP